LLEATAGIFTMIVQARQGYVKLQELKPQFQEIFNSA